MLNLNDKLSSFEKCKFIWFYLDDFSSLVNSTGLNYMIAQIVILEKHSKIFLYDLFLSSLLRSSLSLVIN